MANALQMWEWGTDQVWRTPRKWKRRSSQAAEQRLGHYWVYLTYRMGWSKVNSSITESYYGHSLFLLDIQGWGLSWPQPSNSLSFILNISICNGQPPTGIGMRSHIINCIGQIGMQISRDGMPVFENNAFLGNSHPISKLRSCWGHGWITRCPHVASSISLFF